MKSSTTRERSFEFKRVPEPPIKSFDAKTFGDLNITNVPFTGTFCVQSKTFQKELSWLVQYDTRNQLSTFEVTSHILTLPSGTSLTAEVTTVYDDRCKISSNDYIVCQDTAPVSIMVTGACSLNDAFNSNPFPGCPPEENKVTLQFRVLEFTPSEEKNAKQTKTYYKGPLCSNIRLAVLTKSGDVLFVKTYYDYPLKQEISFEIDPKAFHHDLKNNMIVRFDVSGKYDNIIYETVNRQ